MNIRFRPTIPKSRQAFVTQTSIKKLLTIPERLKYFSKWHHAKRAIAEILRLQQRTEEHLSKLQEFIKELRQAELAIVKVVQEESFTKETQLLRSIQGNSSSGRDHIRQRKATMKKTSSLFRLDPFLDNEGIGGRLTRANVPYHIKHPVILPRKGHITALVIRHYHQRIHHQGRGMTLNELRANGFWITAGSSAVARYISDCVSCRKLRGSTQEQKMADLPQDRLEPSPPFTFCGVDYIGPWRIKQGRPEMKGYGVVFTCLASRAIHLEVAKTLEGDSFINVLRCFLVRCGPMRRLRSDQGTNLVGAHKEMTEAVKEINQDKVRDFLLKKECDWIEFQTNVPTVNHMGGVWERQIRTVRNVLNALLDESGTQLDEESLRTFICENESIVNSRDRSLLTT